MRAPEITIIPIPKPYSKFNRDRKINTLLQYQVRHLLDIEHKQLTASHRTGWTQNPSPMSEQELNEYLGTWTEGQAAKYIQQMTAKLHELRAAQEGPPQPMVVRKLKPKTKGKSKASAKSKSQAKPKAKILSNSKTKLKSKTKPKSRTSSI